MQDDLLVGSHRIGDALDALPAAPCRTPQLFASLCTGQLLALIDHGRTPLVRIEAESGLLQPCRARTLVDLHAGHVGGQVVLYMPNDRNGEPIVMGAVVSDGSQQLQGAGEAAQVTADGKRLVVTATHELVLRCGKASLTLRKDGRIDICGETILTRALGANRVQGGSVQLN